jgi:hypothetical protein
MFYPLTHFLQAHAPGVVYLMKHSELGLATWCLSSWWWIRNESLRVIDWLLKPHRHRPAFRYDVGGVSRGDILFRTGGGPLGVARRLGTHCNATPRFEPVCSAVSTRQGVGLFSPLQQRPAQLVPRVGVRCWMERGDLVGLGRSSAQNVVGLHRPTYLHKPHV